MSKRILAFMLALFMTAPLITGCGRKEPDHGAEAATDEPIELTEDVETEVAVTAEATEKPTPAPTDEPTDAPSEKPTPAPTDRPTASPANTAGSHDYGVFADCAFVGNSVFAGLYAYAVITNSRFFAKVGLNVVTIYETGMTADSEVPVIDELYNGSYRGILLMFGTNECAWPSVDTVLEKYEKLLLDVWVRQPDSILFITGVPPVCKFVNDDPGNDIRNETIVYINETLEEIADKYENAYFIPVPDFMIGPDGALPDEASAGDGIHFNVQYYKKWADHLCEAVSAVLD